MSYRVYDNELKQWINDVYLYPNETLFTYKKKLFGFEKLTMLNNDGRYIVHRDAILKDSDGSLIFEGDICEINDMDVCGVVAYAQELGAYCIFDDANSKYYVLTQDTCSFAKIVGNILDNPDVIKAAEHTDLPDNDNVDVEDVERQENISDMSNVDGDDDESV